LQKRDDEKARSARHRTRQRRKLGLEQAERERQRRRQIDGEIKQFQAAERLELDELLMKVGLPTRGRRPMTDAEKKQQSARVTQWWEEKKLQDEVTPKMKAKLAMMSRRMKQYWVDKKLRQAAEQQSA
jgi:hypothetical protein